MDSVFDSLDGYATKMGSETTIQMVKLAIPYIKQREQQLREALLEGDMKAAAGHAHKAIGSVRIYGTLELEALLCQVRDQDFGQSNSTATQQLLSAEFDRASQALQVWIAKNESK